jgi:hypothetical protein
VKKKIIMIIIRTHNGFIAFNAEVLESMGNVDFISFLVHHIAQRIPTITQQPNSSFTNFEKAKTKKM